MALSTSLPPSAEVWAQPPPTPPPTSASLALADPAAAAAEEEDPDPWPRVLEGAKYRFEVYPPQVGKWDGAELQATTAVAVAEKANPEKRSYGTVDFKARTRVDKEGRIVTIDHIQIERASFPSAKANEALFAGFLQERYANHVRVISLDRLETSLLAAARTQVEAKPVRNDPPVIRIAHRPTMLVYVDGEPTWRPVEGTSFQRLINTRPLVLRAGDGSILLHLFDGWLVATGLEGPWQVASRPPQGIDAAMKATLQRQRADLLEGGGSEKSEVDENGQEIPKPTLAKGPVPDIVLATKPTELIVVDGEAKWTAIPGSKLEYVENTSGNLFRFAGVTYYALLSGRWYAGGSLGGPWRYVSQSELAKEFRSIPDDSPKENVKASVAGTPQAEEAVIANSIPETAEVSRRDAKVEVTYDGEPKFEPIDGSSLTYAVNSPLPVIKAGNAYYVVSNGVWFVAAAATGPWTVAVEVPDEIYAIPPSSPVHYVTYVKIYESTEDEVLVGYTPGYYGTVVSEDVVVYGTGYYYAPWVGSTWWGYPVTWGYGCGITYTPWSGWAFTIGVGWAWGYWGGWYAPYPSPWWGPYYGYGYGWYGGVAVGSGGGWAAWGPGGWAGTTGNIYNQWGNVSSVSRYSGGFNAWTGNAYRGQVGAAYNSRTGNLSAGQRGAVGNIYSGNYAYGGRGAVRNTGSGATVAGGRVTAGNAYTGNEVTAGRIGAYNPNTGQGGTAGYVRGEDGGVARVGDEVFAGKDGNIYHRGDDGSWSEVNRDGNRSRVSDTSRTRDLSRQAEARQRGSQRSYSNRSANPGYSSSRMRSAGMRGGGGRGRIR